MAPENGNARLFGTKVSDMQSGIKVTDTAITGTLKYLSTGALVDTWGAGNFIALKFDSDWGDYSSVKVGLDPSQGSGLVEILTDPDKNGAFKVTTTTQKFVVQTTTTSGTVATKQYDLSGLTLNVS